ncbi:hypothetical protein D3C81_936260 [compost metagenome]
MAVANAVDAEKQLQQQRFLVGTVAKIHADCRTDGFLIVQQQALQALQMPTAFLHCGYRLLALCSSLQRKNA